MYVNPPLPLLHTVYLKRKSGFGTAMNTSLIQVFRFPRWHSLKWMPYSVTFLEKSLNLYKVQKNISCSCFQSWRKKKTIQAKYQRTVCKSFCWFFTWPNRSWLCSWADMAWNHAQVYWACATISWWLWTTCDASRFGCSCWRRPKQPRGKCLSRCSPTAAPNTRCKERRSAWPRLSPETEKEN